MSIQRAIADMKRFSQLNLTQDITFTNPITLQSVTVRGLVSSHNLSVDPNTGNIINSKNIHISVHEGVLNDQGYIVRNDDNEISLEEHLVEWIDASSMSITYQIKEVMPNMTTGLLVCILGDYQ